MKRRDQTENTVFHSSPIKKQNTDVYRTACTQQTVNKAHTKPCRSCTFFLLGFFLWADIIRSATCKAWKCHCAFKTHWMLSEAYLPSSLQKKRDVDVNFYSYRLLRPVSRCDLKHETLLKCNGCNSRHLLHDFFFFGHLQLQWPASTRKSKLRINTLAYRKDEVLVLR